MAHLLEMDSKGEAKMAFTGPRDAVWHQLGHQVPDDISPEEIAKVAGADWEVEKRKMFILDFNGQPVQVKGQQALVRSVDDRVLSIVGDKWHPVQNSEAFAFFNEFCTEGDMKMDTAGVIDNQGRVTVWALAKLKEGFTLPGGDRVNGHLLFANPHEWGKAAVVEFTPIRVVCNNTLTMALRDEKSQYRVNVNHAKKFDPSIVKEALGLAKAKMTIFEVTAQKLAATKASEQDVKKFFAELFPIVEKKDDKTEVSIGDALRLSRNATRLLEINEMQPGAEMSAGTWWSALNAVTYFTDHEYGRSQQGRLDSSWFGTNRRLKLKAMRKALALAV